ncbi:unnamed protein product [Rotaria magnacalcarata]|uniref:Uncharacterized protein n=3 Tax=Rotaria magnacalcarata TaxID=392030 RepID=A0A816YPK4_9BILA|nr:unnamed protein product [Rotaria magnacalcarata]
MKSMARFRKEPLFLCSMDADLDFCLKRFADQQLGESMKSIVQLQHNLKRMNTKIIETSQKDDAVICQQENKLVEQFSHDLNENNMALIKTYQVIEKEFRKALDDIRVDLDAIAQIATARNNNRQSNEEMRMSSNKLRQQIGNIDSELTHLFNMIDFNNSINFSSHIILRFRQHYGYANELRRLIGKNNNSSDSFVFSEKTQLMQYILERAALWIRRQKLIDKFIISIDEDSTPSQHLIESLYRTMDVSSTNKTIQYYIQHRQEERHNRTQQLLYNMELELVEKHIEHQVQATELVNALCQLSARSINEFQLNMKIKKALHQAKTSKHIVPILIDNTKETTVEDLPLIIHLEGNYNRWASNEHSIQQQFCLALCKHMQLPTDSLSIERIEEGGVILHLVIHAPYGSLFIKQVAGHGKNCESSNSKIETIQKCCEKFDSRMNSMGLGKFTLPIEKCLMDFKWNKMRMIDNGSIDNTVLFNSVDQENKEFVCPDGWKRFGIKVAENDTVFNAKWGSWHIAYHGTKGQHAPFILTSGLRVSIQQYSTSKNNQTILLSPSMEYMAHPRHTRIWRHIQNDDGKCRYYQLVFQCRVNPEVVGDPKSETLLQETYKTTRIDKDFCNEELEWFIKANVAAKEFIRDNIICYGLMIRVIDCHPYDLPILNWWKNTDCGEY